MHTVERSDVYAKQKNTAPSRAAFQIVRFFRTNSGEIIRKISNKSSMQKIRLNDTITVVIAQPHLSPAERIERIRNKTSLFSSSFLTQIALYIR